MDPGELCRAVESYLCRKNDGHLIRIVGPAFEMVCDWASAGIPLSVVERAIDKRYLRYYARGPKRHPLRIEYCEADVLDLFDEWKRAVGVGSPSGPDPEEAAAAEAEGAEAGRGPGGSRGRRSLRAHLEELAGRLAVWKPPRGAATLESLLVEAHAVVDAARAGGRTLRGEARRRAIERLEELDRKLSAAARADAGESTLRDVGAEARRTLEPFRSRMPAAEFAKALDAAADRLLAERFELPRLSFD